MQIRLYLDEDAQRESLVKALRVRGIDVETAHEAGLINSPDEENLSHAAERARVLYSFNIRDYYQIHASWLTQGKSHAGILLAQQQRYDTGEQLRRLLRMVQERSALQMVNQLEFLSAWD